MPFGQSAIAGMGYFGQAVGSWPAKRMDARSRLAFYAQAACCFGFGRGA